MIAEKSGKFGKIIDFHVHAFPDKVADRAIEVLYTINKMKPVYDGTISGLISLIEQEGVDFAVIQPVATKASQVKGINDFAASHTDPRILSFGGMHPEWNDPAAEIERMISLGIPGIKIHANWQGVYADDPIMFPIYEAAQGRLIITFHAGEEPTPFDPQRATPERLRIVHENFPNLTINAAHMGGWMMWDECEEHLIGRDLYLDTSACFREYMPDGRMLSMIRRHGADHILFATDLPLARPSAEAQRLMELGLTDNELELILYRNAERLLGERVL
ncbi:MAG: amidohydrolase family protein [Armatimonadota bacterium]|nr:amidohydrolase family protein [bacterium]